MTFLNIIAALCMCVGAVINISAARRNHKKWLDLNEQAHLLDIAAEQLIDDMRRHAKHDVRTKQPELFITANSQDDSRQITLKLSLDDIDIDKVQDRATREFLLKRRLMTSFCPN